MTKPDDDKQEKEIHDLEKKVDQMQWFSVGVGFGLTWVGIILAIVTIAWNYK